MVDATTETPPPFTTFDFYWMLVIMIVGVIFLFLCIIVSFSCMRGTPCYGLRILWMERRKETKERKKREKEEKAALKAKEKDKANPTPVQKSNSRSASNSAGPPVATPAVDTAPPAAAPVAPQPKPMIKVDERGEVDKKITGEEIEAAIRGGLNRPQKDDESADEAASNWGKTQEWGKDLETGASGTSNKVKRDDESAPTGQSQ